MVNTDKTPRQLMLDIFISENKGLKWANEWAKVCCQLSPTPENIVKQYGAISRMRIQ